MIKNNIQEDLCDKFLQWKPPLWLVWTQMIARWIILQIASKVFCVAYYPTNSWLEPVEVLKGMASDIKHREYKNLSKLIAGADTKLPKCYQ